MNQIRLLYKADTGNDVYELDSLPIQKIIIIDDYDTNEEILSFNKVCPQILDYIYWLENKVQNEK